MDHFSIFRKISGWNHMGEAYSEPLSPSSANHFPWLLQPRNHHQEIAWQLELSSLLIECLFLGIAGVVSKSAWERCIPVSSPHLTWCGRSRALPRWHFFITREKQLNRSPANVALGCSVLIFRKPAGRHVLEPEEMLLIGCLLFFNNIWHVSK